MPWFSLASHLEKYPKHASQITLSYGRKMCALMKMTCTQVGLSRQWFAVWILPECELDILAKAVKSCLWRQDLPGCTEKNWFYWFLRLVLSAHMPPPHPFQAPCTSETQTEQVRFNLLKYFWKHWDLLFQVAAFCYWENKDYFNNYCYLQKCSHSQNNFIFFSTVIVFSENTHTFLKHNIHLQYKNWALNHRAEAVCWRIWSQPAEFCYTKYKFTQNTFSYRLLSSFVDSSYGLSLLLKCKSNPSKIQYHRL